MAVLVITTVLGGAYFFTDLGDLLGGDLTLPPVPDTGLGTALLMVGGILIAVQGFETVRYLGDEYDAATRIWASRVAQAVAASIYIGFVAVATPLMGLGMPAGADGDLIDITERVASILVPLLVLTAVLSQLSAATADTAAVGGNLHSLASRAMRGPRAYALNGVAAVVLIWSVPTFTIIAVASRAFAAYYCVQCVIALRTCEGTARKFGYGALGGPDGRDHAFRPAGELRSCEACNRPQVPQGRAVPLWYRPLRPICPEVPRTGTAGTRGTLRDASSRPASRLGVERSLVQIQSPRLAGLSLSPTARC